MAAHPPRGRSCQGLRSLLTRPMVERLEDRVTPATVTNLNNSGAGSLRDAIANTPAGGVIDFAPGLTGTIKLATVLQVTKSVTIVGPGNDAVGSPLITISGGKTTQIFNTATTGGAFTFKMSKLALAQGKGDGGAMEIGDETVELTDVTIRDCSGGIGSGIWLTGGGLLTMSACTMSGNTASVHAAALDVLVGTAIVRNTVFANNTCTGTGGAVHVHSGENLELDGCTFTGNFSSSDHGGGVYVESATSTGPLIVRRCTFDNNRAARDGGALWATTSAGGAVIIEDTTFSNNTTGEDGGGFFVGGAGSADITNVTVAQNTAKVDGGGVATGGSIFASFRNVTIGRNNADSDSNGTGSGGGLFSGSSNTALVHVIVGDNTKAGSATADGSNIAGKMQADYCLFETVGTATVTTTSVNLPQVDAKLGKLQNNGGPTRTMALLADSPAINAGDANLVPGLLFDQRGGGFNRVIAGQIDIGAYEYQPPAVAVKLSSSYNPAGPNDPVTITAAVAGVAENSNVVRGTVNIYVNGELVLSTALDQNGEGLYTTSFSKLGTYDVTAKYLGFSGFNPNPADDDYRFNPAEGQMTQVVQILPPPPNTPPQIGDIPDRLVPFNGSTGPLPFGVSDKETPAGELALSATSTNLELVPIENIVFGGAGANRTVTITPVEGKSGTAIITVFVTDGGGATAFDTFIITVPAGTVPPPPPPPAPPPPPVPPLPPIPVGLTAVGAGPGAGPHVKVLNADGSVRFNLFPYSTAFSGGVRVATGDVNADGIDDVVAAPGPSGGPHIKIYDGKTGTQIANFFAYTPEFTGGVYVAVGDIDGDGFADVVVGAGVTGAPHVRAFSGAAFTVSPNQFPVELANFFAFDRRFRGGVTVAVADTDGDGIAEIVTGAGPDGGPHVRVFDGRTLEVEQTFFAYDPSFRGGVSVAAGDLDGDRKAEIVTGPGAGGAPHVRIFRNGSEVASFFAFDESFTGGVTVAVNTNRDGPATIVVGAGPGGGPAVRSFTDFGATEVFGQFPFAAAFNGGTFVG